MKRMRKRQPVNTPVRIALLRESRLQASVRVGLGALKRNHCSHIERSLRAEFADCLDKHLPIQKTG
jgi:hypothetical protein